MNKIRLFSPHTYSSVSVFERQALSRKLAELLERIQSKNAARLELSRVSSQAKLPGLPGSASQKSSYSEEKRLGSGAGQTGVKDEGPKSGTLPLSVSQPSNQADQLSFLRSAPELEIEPEVALIVPRSSSPSFPDTFLSLVSESLR